LKCKNSFFNVTLAYLLSFFLWSVPVTADDGLPSVNELTPRQWLKKMQMAATEQDYKGTFVFMRGAMSSTMSVVHRFQNGIERELLKQLDGEMGEIIRNGAEVVCVFPDHRTVQLEQSKYSNSIVQTFASFMPDQSEYELSVMDDGRIVERPCVQIHVAAMDEDRYSYRLWLDKETGLLLKSSLMDQNGKVLERLHYTEVEFPDSISESELKGMNTGGVVTHEMISDLSNGVKLRSDLMWTTGWSPKGYKKVNSDGASVMVYSDGLATYSIFIEELKDDAMPEGAVQVGATIAYSYQRKVNSGQYNVTVMGEIPAMTAMKVAESVMVVPVPAH